MVRRWAHKSGFNTYIRCTAAVHRYTYMGQASLLLLLLFWQKT